MVTTLVAIAPLSAEGSTILSVALDESVAKADIIFVGTVSRLEYVPITGGVFTKVTFKNLNRVKGNVMADSLVVSITGGVWGGNLYKTVGFPEFEVSARYLLCVDDNLGTESDRYQPITFWNQGFFPLITDEHTARLVVHDCDYRPVVRIQDRHLVVLANPVRPRGLVERLRARARSSPGKGKVAKMDTLRGLGHRVARIVMPDELDPRTRLGEEEFVREVRSIVQRR